MVNNSRNKSPCNHKTPQHCCSDGPVLNSALSSLKIEWLDSEEAAKILRLSVGALRNMTSNGQIPFYKLGHRNRYRKDELESLLLSQRKGK